MISWPAPITEVILLDKNPPSDITSLSHQVQVDIVVDNGPVISLRKYPYL